MPQYALASVVQIYRKLLEANGLDVPSLCGELGVTLDTAGDPNARLAVKDLDAVFSRAASLIPNEAWGLKAGKCWHPGNLGVLGHAWLASSTLRTGLNRLVRYWRILGERAAIRLDDTAVGLTFTYAASSEHPAVDPVLPDTVFSILVDMCSANAGRRIRPSRVALRRTRPANAEPWTDCFGCDVAFGAPENSITFATADMDQPLPTANRPLAGMFDKLLTEQLSKLAKDDVVSRCKAVFLEQLTSGEPSEEEIAARLHMSRRSLQRKLAEVETTYLRVVDDTRRDMALRYIEDRSKSISDVTFLLGFSGQSAFSRAFRRWTGVSPTEHRRRTAIPSGS